MNKIFRILFWSALLFFSLLWLGSWGLQKYWARDHEEIQVSSKNYDFSATRSDLGVWQIKTQNDESLWFALGYVHAHDREFQIELYRMLSLGRVSEWFGEKTLKRDRLMRMSSRVARAEWDALSNDSMLKKAAISYVEGIKAHRFGEHRLSNPIEFTVFQIDGKTLPEWEPWHVLALGRFQTWQFAFDLDLELRLHAMKELLGDSMASMLTAKGQKLRKPLYEQDWIRKKGLSRYPRSTDSTQPDFSFSKQLNELPKKPPEGEELSSLSPKGDLAFLDWGVELHGASNSWIVQAQGKNPGLTFCNDTHLKLLFPNQLYPVAYKISDRLSAKGFSLPGLPALVIGQMDAPLESDPSEKNLFSWGITLGAFTDTQQLQIIKPNSGDREYVESFGVRNLDTLETKSLHFKERWTAKGPVVSGIVDKYGLKLPEHTVLDWISFRGLKSPAHFLIPHTVGKYQDTASQLERHWKYPSVNFSWVRSQGSKQEGFKQSTGHVLTGMSYEASGRKARRLAAPWTPMSYKLRPAALNPYFETKLKAQEPFFMASGNQAVYSSSLSHRLADFWVPGARSERLLELEAQLTFEPASGQNDVHSILFKEFIESLKAQQLLSNLCPDEEKVCSEVLGGLRKYKGNADLESWPTTVVSIWIKKVLQQFWGRPKIFKDDESLKLFSRWAYSYEAEDFLRRLLEDKKLRRRVLKEANLEWESLLRESLLETLAMLKENVSPEPGKWQWKHFHKIFWEHPFELLPGGMGQMMMSSLFGLPRSVPGAPSTPAAFRGKWTPAKSLEFRVKHAAAMRFCTTHNTQNGTANFSWTMPNGVSGNPFSKWAWQMSKDLYYNDLLRTQSDDF